MRVVYSDESGTGDRKQQITVVTAILLDMDGQWIPIEREISALKLNVIPKGLLHFGKGDLRLSTLTQNPELKGDRLFKGLRGKIHGIAPEKAVEALAGVLSVAVRNRVQIFHGAIDRAGRAEWWSTRGVESSEQPTDEEAALMECLGRLDAFVHTYMPKESILWIADKSGFEKSVKHGLKFFQLINAFDIDALRRLLVERARERGITDFKLPVFDHHPSHVLDTIYFGHSHESLALQLADVCCSVVAQHLLEKGDAEPFYDLIRGQVIGDGTVIRYSDAWRARASAKISKI